MTNDMRHYIAGFDLVLTFASVMYCYYLMSRKVNQVLPPGIPPFPPLIDRRRGFELVRVHRRSFPNSWLQEIQALLLVAGLACAAALSYK